MNKHAWWAWAIKNSVCVICWTILAVVFNDWRIALVSILFMSSLKTDNSLHYIICDKCGIHSPYAQSYNEAIEKARAAGWIIRKNGTKWDDRCPECQKMDLKEEYKNYELL